MLETNKWNEMKNTEALLNICAVIYIYIIYIDYKHDGMLFTVYIPTWTKLVTLFRVFLDEDKLLTIHNNQVKKKVQFCLFSLQMCEFVKCQQ